MFTKAELSKKEDLLSEAYKKQELIRKAKALMEGLEVEYNQIINYCKERDIEKQGEYTLKTVKKTRREIIPTLFLKEFPEANEILVAKEIAFQKTELEILKMTHILPFIRIEDTKDLILKLGKLNKACKIFVTEKTSIVKANEE